MMEHQDQGQEQHEYAAWNESPDSDNERQALKHAIDKNLPEALQEISTLDINQLIGICENGSSATVTPLIYAIMKKKTEIIEILVTDYKARASLACRMNPNDPQSTMTPWQAASKYGAPIEVTAFLVSRARRENNGGWHAVSSKLVIEMALKKCIPIDRLSQLNLNSNLEMVVQLLTAYPGTYETSETFIQLLNDTWVEHLEFRNCINKIQRILKLLIERGFNLNHWYKQRQPQASAAEEVFVDAEEFGLIHLATVRGNLSFLQFLLEQKKLNVELLTKCGKSALYYAVEAEKMDICLLLLGRGADVNLRRRTGVEIRDLLDLTKSQEMCSLLLDKGYRDPVNKIHDCMGSKDSSRLRLAGNILAHCTWIKFQDLDFNSMHRQNLTLFQPEARRFFNFAISHGFRPDEVNPVTGNSLLHHCVIKGRMKLFDFFINHEELRDLTLYNLNRDGYAVIHLAAMRSFSPLSTKPIIQRILRHSPALAVYQTSGGLTPLHIAACEGNVKNVQLLIERGCSVDPNAPWNALASLDVFKQRLSSLFAPILALRGQLATEDDICNEIRRHTHQDYLTTLQLILAMVPGALKLDPLKEDLRGTRSPLPNLASFHFAVLSGDCIALILVLNIKPGISLRNCETLGFPSLQLWAHINRKRFGSGQVWVWDEIYSLLILRTLESSGYDLAFENENSSQMESVLQTFLTSATPSDRVLKHLLSRNLTNHRKKICVSHLTTWSILKTLLLHCFDTTTVTFDGYDYEPADKNYLVVFREAGAPFPSLRDFFLNHWSDAPIPLPPSHGLEFLLDHLTDDEKEQVEDVLKIFSQPRLSLQHLCRLELRKLVHLKPENVDKLHCPKKLRSYIKMEAEVREWDQKYHNEFGPGDDGEDW